MLRKVGEKGTVKVKEAKDTSEYKKMENQKMENKWKEKQIHGQYVWDMKGVDWENSNSNYYYYYYYYYCQRHIMRPLKGVGMLLVKNFKYQHFAIL